MIDNFVSTAEVKLQERLTQYDEKIVEWNSRKEKGSQNI